MFNKAKIAETYNIGGFYEWKNIDIIKVVIKTVERLLGSKEGKDMDLITYVTDRKGYDMRYAIDSRKLQKELDWESSRHVVRNGTAGGTKDFKYEFTFLILINILWFIVYSWLLTVNH